jgi:hypothetical protein
MFSRTWEGSLHTFLWKFILPILVRSGMSHWPPKMQSNRSYLSKSTRSLELGGMAPLFSFSLNFSPKKKQSYLVEFSHPLMGHPSNLELWTNEDIVSMRTHVVYAMWQTSRFSRRSWGILECAGGFGPLPLGEFWEELAGFQMRRQI